MKKTFLLLTAMLFSVVIAFAQGGTTGPLTWNLNGGTLTISGNGDMPDYSVGGTPWNLYLNSITAIVIQNGVTKIGNEAFNGCSSLPMCTIPNNVNTIGTRAFANCTSLQSVYIEPGTTTLTFTAYGDDSRKAFYGSSIGSLHLGRRVNNYSANAPFRDNKLLYSLVVGKNVTDIYDSYFDGCEGLESLTIEDESELTTFGNNAFNGCLNLESHLTIPNKVNLIGNDAFNGCRKVPSLFIPKSVNTIGTRAFANCTSLQNVFIEPGTPSTTLTFTVYGDGSRAAFYGSSIGSLHLGRRVNNYSANAPFRDNKLLYSLVIGRNVTDIYDSYFDGCEGLESLTIEDESELTTFGNNAFNGCLNLESHLTIPNKVNLIGNDAFNGCRKIPSLFIPKSVNTIGTRAFANCTSLQNVYIEPGTTTLTFTVYGDDSRKAFYESSIGNLYLGRRVNNYPANAPFRNNTLLDSLTIGINVDNLPDYYFSGCIGLKQITSHPCPAPTVGNNTFNGVLNDIPIYPNCTCLSSYQSLWNYFTNFICDIPPVIITTTLPNGLVGTPYNQVLIATGTIPITWSLENESLPYGLDISAAGVISGTPNMASTFEFTIKATNIVGSDTKILRIIIENDVSIPENELSGIFIYPNPTTGKLRIESEELKIESVEIFDVYGRKLFSHSLYSEFNISHFSAGIYFVKIFTDAGEVVRKIMKE